MENSRSDTAHFVVRERYLNAIEAFIDRPVVKVLKGMRRVGKSVIMRLLIERLINRGIPGANILYINMGKGGRLFFGGWPGGCRHLRLQCKPPVL